MKGKARHLSLALAAALLAGTSRRRLNGRHGAISWSAVAAAAAAGLLLTRRHGTIAY